MSVPFLYHEVPEAPENGAFLMPVFGTGLAWVFHDTRHEAITRLCKKLDVLSLARMIGHADIRELNTYYNATAEDIANYL